MKPIKIRIRKKTLVLTKYQANHKWRSDWKLVGIIDYNESFEIFKSVNSGGVCYEEAQFAKLLYDNYGIGIYSCIAWIRNRGDGRFFGFWKGELKETGFMRLPKNLTAEMKERKHNVIQLKKLKKDLTKDNITTIDISDIQSEIDNLQEELGMNLEIIELENDNRSGPSGYLKCAIPVFKFHAYEKYGNFNNITEINKVDFY